VETELDSYFLVLYVKFVIVLYEKHFCSFINIKTSQVVLTLI